MRTTYLPRQSKVCHCVRRAPLSAIIRFHVVVDTPLKSGAKIQRYLLARSPMWGAILSTPAHVFEPLHCKPQRVYNVPPDRGDTLSRVTGRSTYIHQKIQGLTHIIHNILLCPPRARGVTIVFPIAHSTMSSQEREISSLCVIHRTLST